MASSSSSCIAPPHFSRAPKIPIYSSVPSRCDLNPVRLSFSPSHSPNRISLTAKNTLPRFTVSCSREFKAAVVTKDSWEQSVLNSQVPVLVEFYASWCGPCKMVHRVIDEIARDYAGKLRCFVLNADIETQVAEDYGIKAVPVVLLFKNGEKRDTVVGTMPKEFYVDAIERLLTL